MEREGWSWRTARDYDAVFNGRGTRSLTGTVELSSSRCGPSVRSFMESYYACDDDVWLPLIEDKKRGIDGVLW